MELGIYMSSTSETLLLWNLQEQQKSWGCINNMWDLGYSGVSADTWLTYSDLTMV